MPTPSRTKMAVLAAAAGTLLSTTALPGGAAQAAAAAVTMSPAAPTRDFTASAPLWRPIRSSPVLDRASAQMADLLGQPGASRVALLYTFGNKIYHADANTPRYDVNVTNEGLNRWGDNVLAHQSVPIPLGAVPSAGTDGKLVIVDDSTDQVFDLWQVSRSGSTWNVAWGGVYPLRGNGSSLNPAYGNGRFGVAWPQPVSRGTGSGLSTLAGTVKMSEIAAGYIPHAMVFATDRTCGPAQTGRFRWPATTTDGSMTSGTCIPEGAHIQLDPSIDITAIPGITKGEIAVGRALQTYGAYASDQGGSRISFGFEAPKSGDINPYPAAGFTSDYYPLSHLPWTAVRVLASWSGA